MISLITLLDNTVKLRKKVVINQTQIKKVTYKIIPGGVLVTGKVVSSRGTETYTVNVEVATQVIDTPKKGYVEKPFGSKKLYIKKVKKDAPVLRVRCDCEDFRFTWAKALKKAGALYGKDFPAYVPTGTGTPNKNSKTQYAGACKHTISVLYDLRIFL